MAHTPTFITIDDLYKLSRKLTDGLGRLGKYRHPLAVRRGRKGVMTMNDNEDSQQVKGAGRTYFFDVGKTREGKPYLRITESRKDDKEKWQRSTVNVFPEDAEAFAEAVTTMTGRLK